MNALLNWFDDRTGVRKLLHEALYEPIPGGAKWKYVWGSTLVFVFVLQMATGFLLWSAYSPSTFTAWESVYYIQHEMPLGWLIRGLHHFSAQMMMVLLGLHFLQVILCGAYQAPREINFWLGLALMQIVLGLSLTGYLLPWDQKGYYATQVTTKIMAATPVIGPQIQQIAQGGPRYGHHTLTRFFAMHAGLLPLLLMGLLALHIAVFRKHGIKTPDPQAAPGMFWPDQILKDAVACFAVLATVLALTIFRGAELGAPADPAEPYQAARPEWYFLFLFQFLRFEAVEQFGLAFGAIHVPGAIMTVVALMPIIGRWKMGHRFNIAFTLGLGLAIVFLTSLALKNDAADPEFQGHVAAAHREAERAMELVKDGAPPAGTLALMAEDPFIQGPRLFAKHCKACHRFDGHDGTLRPVLKLADAGHGGHGAKVPDDATAADLGSPRFGSKAWTKAVLVDYEKVFEPTKRAKFNDVDVSDRFLTGDMATWSKENREALLKPENAESLAALVEFLFEQSGRSDDSVDAALAAKGKEIFQSGALASGGLTSACGDCHSMRLKGEGEASLFTEGGGGPMLTGYGGHAWVNWMVRFPHQKDMYGDRNAMPAFSESKITDKELGLLAVWLTSRPTSDH